jgi:hypothetical protein
VDSEALMSYEVAEACFVSSHFGRRRAAHFAFACIDVLLSSYLRCLRGELGWQVTG